MTEFFITDISSVEVDQFVSSGLIAVGLDIGDKTIGVAVSDRRIKIASGLTTIPRNGTCKDFQLLLNSINTYKVGAIIFGWPIQMNGTPGKQCEKVIKFIYDLSERISVYFIKWDERFSTKAVDDLMIQADLSRKKRKKTIDKNAATYMLQGAIDFINNSNGFHRCT